MKITHNNVNTALLIIVVFVSFSLKAEARESVDPIVVDRALDQVMRQNQMRSVHSVEIEVAPIYVAPQISMNHAQPYKGISPSKIVNPSIERDSEGLHIPAGHFYHHKESVIEIGYEYYDYNYDEPTIDVQNEGSHSGLYGIWTYRPTQPQPIEKWGDMLDGGMSIHMYRIEARYARGEVDYSGSGTYEGLRDDVFELRGLVGRDYITPKQMVITPYTGFGYRYLKNGADEIPARFVGSQQFYSGYERESYYFYWPIGVDVSQAMNQKWSYKINAELDVLLDGEQVSHLEDMVDMNGNSANIDKISNDQNEGYGLRGSVKFVRSGKKFDLAFEPFVRYWNIEDSEVEPIVSSGNIIGGGLEPENETLETGVRMGVIF